MKAKVIETGEIVEVNLYCDPYYKEKGQGYDRRGQYEDELEFEPKKFIIYIVARPFDELKQFIPQYITTHKEKAQKFWSMYNDESIQMVIFSKEWSSSDNNILFNYCELCEEDEEDDMCENNTLYKKYEEFINMDEEEAELYWSGDENEEKTESGMLNPKIWKLD